MKARPGIDAATRRAAGIAALLLALLLGGCDRPAVPELLRAEVVAVHPHDPDAFTQGLLFHQGRLYESTGRYGRSDLREVDLESGTVVRQRPLEPRFFGEGLALVDDRLIQLSYREGVAFAYDLETFNELTRYRYTGEGWGLCFDGQVLWMSDGSSSLQRRDPETFELLGRLEVRREGREVPRLNELACSDGSVVANVWLTTELVRIDTNSGAVTAVIDASALVPDDPRLRNDRDAVLNGVAVDPTGERWWLTGKLWPLLYEVRFVPR
jgi:glutamine cyclotransferase